MTVRSLLPHLVALALGGVAALLVSCGSSSGLIPAGNAQQLTSNLQNVADAVADGDCASAVAAVGQVGAAVAQLPASVDLRLRLRLGTGTKRLIAAVPNDCKQATPTTPHKPKKKKKTTTTTTAPATTVSTTTTTPVETDTSSVPTATTPPVTDTETTPATSTSTTGGVGAP
jgi:hypothetical protein